MGRWSDGKTERQTEEEMKKWRYVRQRGSKIERQTDKQRFREIDR
jgi:hypothetical protein